MTPRLRKALLVAGGLALGLGLTEGALRGLYADLPSVAALADTPYRVYPFEMRGMASRRRDTDLRCKEASYIDAERNRPDIEDRDRVTSRTFKRGSSLSPLSLWVIGDSVTAGMGLATGKAFGFHLAAQLSAAAGRTVELINMGMPGAGYCAVLRRAHAALDKHKPGLVVLAFFADDLEDRAMMAGYDKPVLFHDRLESPALQAVVSRSYLANLAWYVFELQAPRRQRRFVDERGQVSFRAGVAGVQRRVQGKGGDVLAVLLSPVGLPACPAPAAPHSRCDWMARDLALMKRLLQAEAVPLLDLSRLWHRVKVKPVARERALAESWLAIHPDAAGHRALAEALLPAVLERTRGD